MQHYHSLRGHTRMVTDIDWHSKNSNLLVSCSIDTFSHIWDLRDPRKPTLSLSAVCMCKYSASANTFAAYIKFIYKMYYIQYLIELQLVQHKLVSIVFRVICWRRHMMVIFVYGICERVRVLYIISQLI